jgi:hypothetical protein
MVAVPYALDQSTLESSPPLPRKDPERTIPTTVNNSGALLAERPMVPLSGVTEHHSSSISDKLRYPASLTTDEVSLSCDEINTIRLDALSSSGIDTGLSPASRALINQPRLADTATNRSYRRSQELFVIWAFQHDVPVDHFIPADLANFLSEMYHQRGYQLGTLKLMRSAVSHLHRSPLSLRVADNNPINAIMDSLASLAPPRLQYKPEVHISKSLKHLSGIRSSVTTTLSALQPKTAFLLAMAAFLRPSDLHRLDFASCRINDQGVLFFNIVAPKERRKKQRIIKTLMAHPNNNDATLCPVAAFVALRDHPLAKHARPPHALFVHSFQPNRAVFSTTIASWLRRLLRLSTPETNVSVRSVAASLALQRGVPLEDIITLGNWSSSTTFENHYRRFTMLNTDFTSAILQNTDDEEEDDNDDDDIYLDAPLEFISG